MVSEQGRSDSKEEWTENRHFKRFEIAEMILQIGTCITHMKPSLYFVDCEFDMLQSMHAVAFMRTSIGQSVDEMIEVIDFSQNWNMFSVCVAIDSSVLYVSST